MAEWTEGWLRRGFADWLGPSWRSTLLGVVSIVMGLVLFLLGWATGEATLKVMGLGLVPTGILGLITRDNSASTAAHEESMRGIEEARGDHIDNQVKIANLAVAVGKVPEVVAQVVQKQVPTAVAQVLNEPPLDERRH